MTSQSNAFLSSSIVKEIALLNGKTEQFVPKCVEKSLKEKARNIRNENF
jgi:phosphopantetheine adenylyltransferase